MSDQKLERENAERILKEGWKLFQQKGYRGVSVDELCQRCGLTKPTLYYYFEDKENLFVQVLGYQLQGLREAIEEPGTLSERLQHTATAILENFQTQYTTLLHDREHIKKPENLRAIRDAFRSEMFAALIALMQSGIDQGALKNENPETLSLIFLGMINNFINRAAEMNTNNQVLASMLTAYFLEGASKK
jgi:AcrR family transcriptional regulator